MMKAFDGGHGHTDDRRLYRGRRRRGRSGRQCPSPPEGDPSRGQACEASASGNALAKRGPYAFLEIAFERFSRADRSRTAAGAGLGLSIVRSIARAHDGDAFISNDDGGGAHVWLSIPDAPTGSRALLSEAPSSRAGSNGALVSAP
jgi:hypothetical protein